jgi:hypothetical protein
MHVPLGMYVGHSGRVMFKIFKFKIFKKATTSPPGVQTKYSDSRLPQRNDVID